MLLSSLREQRAIVSQAISVRDNPTWLNYGPLASSGIHVDDTAALGYIPFVACIKAISEPLGMFPLKVFEKQAAGRVEATSDPLYYLVHDEPNPMMTAPVFREFFVASAVGAGDGIAWIEFDKAGRLKGLWPLRADRTKIEKHSGRLWYTTYADEGKQDQFEDWEILHVPGMGNDGTRGYRPVRLMAEALGLGIAAERFGASLFGRGAHTSGALQSPKQLSKPAADRLVKQIEERIGGPHNSHRPLVLEEGLTWNPVSINPNEAQFLETRNFQAVEVARFMRVPASEIDAAAKDSMTYSNVEQDAMRFVTRTLLKWATAVEAEMNRKCFSASKIGRFYVKHDFKALMRGDMKSRFDAYKIAGGGYAWASKNEIRSWEEMNAVEGGDKIPEDRIPDPITPTPDPGTPTKAKKSARTIDETRIVDSCRALFLDVATRVLRREEKGFAAAWPKISRDGVKAFEMWGEAFYRGHESYVAAALTPAIAVLTGSLGADVDGAAHAADAARDHCRYSKLLLAEAIANEQRGPSTDAWNARAGAIAEGQIKRVLDAIEAAKEEAA